MTRRAVLLVSIAGILGLGLPPWVAHAAQAGNDRSHEAGASQAKAAEVTVAQLREAARRGDVQSQYDLAVALDCGRDVKRDRAEALEWLRQAAGQGHVAAQGALGWKYMTGEGVGRDDAAAFQWLRQAAERGNTPAQNNLGILYALGRGVAADPIEAAKWFRRAAEKGAADAQRNLDALLAGRHRDVRPTAEPLGPRV